MIIIGEKINGAIPKTAEAIKERDQDYIVNLVKIQEAAGADYLDVCAGTVLEEEPDALNWLIDTVQSVAEKPICIDSPDPEILARVLPKIKKPGMINSISLEGSKCDILLPLLAKKPDWQVIALCCDSNGIAARAEDKVRIGFELIEKAGAYGIAPGRIHIAPLVLALSAVNDSALSFCKAMGIMKEKYPNVHMAAALSNISYGMPARGLVNRNFLTMAMIAGLDTAIVDPTSKAIRGNLFATEALLGKDRHCRKYNKAFRANELA